MTTVRVFFTKTGRATYISHLDLSRAMQRSFKRAGLPVWYTEGFNPRIYLTFALPLSLGYSGMRESMDFRLIMDMPAEEIVTRLNAHLPEGLSAISAAEPVMKPASIARAHYRLEIPAPVTEVEGLLNKPAILAKKTSKRKVTETIDIKPDIKLISLTGQGDMTVLQLMLPAGSQKNLNPALIMAALEADMGELHLPAAISRLGLFTAEGRPFA